MKVEQTQLSQTIDLVLVDTSQTAEVDITGHENIRIQFAPVENASQYIMLKDVILKE